MRICLWSVAPRTKSAQLATVAADYEQRLGKYVELDTQRFASESALLERPEPTGRTPPRLVLLDSRGKRLSSEELAQWMGRERDNGAQRLVFAIGPADGWSAEARSRADLLLSFGPMTFPHELARVMLTEQIYRAFTILAGHPYHSGH